MDELLVCFVLLVFSHTLHHFNYFLGLRDQSWTENVLQREKAHRNASAMRKIKKCQPVPQGFNKYL